MRSTDRAVHLGWRGRDVQIYKDQTGQPRMTSNGVPSLSESARSLPPLPALPDKLVTPQFDYSLHLAGDTTTCSRLAIPHKCL